MSLQEEYEIVQIYIQYICIKDVYVDYAKTNIKVGDKFSLNHLHGLYYIENSQMELTEAIVDGNFITIEEFRKSKINTIID